MIQARTGGDGWPRFDLHPDSFPKTLSGIVSCMSSCLCSLTRAAGKDTDCKEQGPSPTKSAGVAGQVTTGAFARLYARLTSDYRDATVNVKKTVVLFALQAACT